MKTKISQSIIGGIIAALVMSIFNMLTPYLGLPEMSAPKMLAMMLNVPIFSGWLMHFLIGIMFAMIYAYVFLSLFKKIRTKLVKGILYGIIVFIMAQIAIPILGAIMGGMPPMTGNMVLMAIGSMLSHIVYGIVVAMFVRAPEEAPVV
jgi:hypothetical protein